MERHSYKEYQIYVRWLEITHNIKPLRTPAEIKRKIELSKRAHAEMRENRPRKHKGTQF